MLQKYEGLESFFAGTPPLDEWVGWFLCLGFGCFFCVFTLLLVYLDQKYGGTKITSEQFNTAGRSVQVGLTASVIVSQWTWAATLLQSSNVAWGFGVSGPFWYASGATVQILLFGILSIQLKARAKKAHTVCEMVKVRWGTGAHITFLIFCFLANTIVTSMLILGGAATVNALTGMDVIAAGFLIPVFVIPYTMAGGLKATFMASYVHTAIIFLILVVFMYTVYIKTYSSDIIYDMMETVTHMSSDECEAAFSTDAGTFYEEGKYACGPVPDNLRGSYLTMLSVDGIRFGIINLIGNFGTVFVDQSYWQSAIAAKPAAAHKGYMLGGLVWFTIPFTLATSMGLSALALQLPVTNIESGRGLVPAAVAVHLFGGAGAWMIAIMLFMAIISTGSAESIAVSSIVAYDIYRTYINPKATGKQILTVSRIAICVWGAFMGVLSAILQVIGESEPSLGLGWVYTFMGNAIGSAVVPLTFLLLWKDANAFGAIAGAWIGLILAISCWILHASTLEGGVTVANLGTLDANLTGNLMAILSSGLIHTVSSLVKPQNYDWKDLDEGLTMCDAEDEDEAALDDEDYSPEKLEAAKGWIMKWGITLSFVLFIIWPLLSIPAGVFTKDYFSFWIFVALTWGFLATAVIIILPIWESKNSILAVVAGITGLDVEIKEKKETEMKNVMEPDMKTEALTTQASAL